MIEVNGKNLAQMARADVEATQLRAGRWAIRPVGQLGTCGFHPFPWHVVFVNAPTAEQAIRKMRRWAGQ
jgi:hypothetical protein